MLNKLFRRVWVWVLELIELFVLMFSKEIKVCVSLFLRGICFKLYVWVCVLFKGFRLFSVKLVFVRLVCVWMFKYNGLILRVCIEFLFVVIKFGFWWFVIKEFIGGRRWIGFVCDNLNDCFILLVVK